MAYIDPKRDYKDGEILYGIDLTASNEVIKAGVDDNFDRIKGLQENKQDTLESGINIKTINNESILGEGNLIVEGTGTTDYDELENQPSINNVTLEGNKSLSDLGIDIPTKISDLNNDNNTVTDANYVHTDSNYTAIEKSKLAGIEAGAQANVTEVVVDNTPTADTQLVIDLYDISPSSAATEITNQTSSSTELAYSCAYTNDKLDTINDELSKVVANGNASSFLYGSNVAGGKVYFRAENSDGSAFQIYSTNSTIRFEKRDATTGNWSSVFDISTELGKYLPLVGGSVTGNITLENASYLKGKDTSNNIINLIRAYGNMNCIGDSTKETRIWSSVTPTISVGGSVKTLATTEDTGNLSSLSTTEKSNLVGAVNEVNSKVELTNTVKNFLAGYNPNNNNFYLRTENQDNSDTQLTFINGTDLALQKRVGNTWSSLFRFSDFIGDFIKTAKFNICNNKTIPANSSPATTVVDVPQITGYKAINVRLENLRSADLNLWYMLLDDDGKKISWRVGNLSSTDISATITVVVEYEKLFN